MFTDKFLIALSELSWKRSHSKFPSKATLLVMRGLEFVGQTRTVKINSRNEVLPMQGEDICEAASRLGWINIEAQRLKE